MLEILFFFFLQSQWYFPVTCSSSCADLFYPMCAQASDTECSLSTARVIPVPPWPSSHPTPGPIPVGLDKPFLLALVYGLREVGVVVHDGSVGALGWLRPFGLVGVVGSLVAEHVADQEHQGAEDGEDHHCDHTCTREERRDAPRETSCRLQRKERIPKLLWADLKLLRQVGITTVAWFLLL